MKKMLISLLAIIFVVFSFLTGKFTHQGLTKKLPADYKQFVIGHRGARPMVTENTISAFKFAKEQGIKIVELDVMLTADQIPVVFHDDTLERLAGNTSRIDELTFEQLQLVTLPNNEHVPTFDAVVKLLKSLELSVNVEIKPSKPEFSKLTAQKAWEVIKENKFEDYVFFSSFDLDSLAELQQIAPQIKRAVLVEDPAVDWREPAKKLKVFSINYDANLLTDELIKEINEKGYKLLVWTVNDENVARQLFEKGIYAVFSDNPNLLK